MASSPEARDVVGHEIATDLMARRRGPEETYSTSLSPNAWFEAVFTEIHHNRCHAYCAAPGMPADVLWAAWQTLGPPPPPEVDVSVSNRGAYSEREGANGEFASSRWRVLLEDSSLGHCVACVKAYRTTVDQWDAQTAEFAATEEDEDKGVLSALLRERDETRLETQAARLANELSDGAANDSSTSQTKLERALEATVHEALSYPDALHCSASENRTKNAVANALLALSLARSFSGDSDDGLQKVANVMTKHVSLGKSPGVFELLSDPSNEAIRELMRASFGKVCVRPIDDLSEHTVGVIKSWVATIWSSFENARSGCTTSENLSAKHVAWHALACALTHMTSQPRYRLMELFPEVIDAALDELSTSQNSLACCAAKILAELISADPGTCWSDDSNGASLGTVLAVVESCARNAPDSQTHAACVAAIGACLYSASFVIDDGPQDRGTSQSNTQSTQRAFEFLSIVVPSSPHLFMETVSWAALRCVCDLTRAGYGTGKPPSATSEFWLKTLAQASVLPPNLGSLAPHAATAQISSARDRGNARLAAAAVVASALRADAAALAALEHKQTLCAGDAVPDVDAFGVCDMTTADGEFGTTEVDDESHVFSNGTYQWEDRDAVALNAVSLTRRVRESRAAAFAARAQVCGNQQTQWECIAATRVTELCSPFLFGNNSTGVNNSSTTSIELSHTNGVVLSALLASGCELALSPSAAKRNKRKSGFGERAGASGVDSTYSKLRNLNSTASSNQVTTQCVTSCVPFTDVASLMARDVGYLLTKFAETETYSLTKAALPGCAIRNAVGMFLGQREDLRVAGKALLQAQAFGGNGDYSEGNGDSEETWAALCQFPEARAAALEGALLSGKAANALVDSTDRLVAVAQVATQARELLKQAELAEKREDVESATLPSAAGDSVSSKRLKRDCYVLRKDLCALVWDLVTGVLAEAHETANHGWAQGNLCRVFRAAPGVFTLWATRVRVDDDDCDWSEQRKQDRVSAMWWVPESLQMCAVEKTTAVSRHFVESLDSVFAAMTAGSCENENDGNREAFFASKTPCFPTACAAAARDAFALLLASKSDTSSLTAFLARWFPGDAPGNLGVGSLQGLPGSNERTTSTPHGKTKEIVKTTPVRSLNAKALREYEIASSHKKHSLRERLVTEHTPVSDFTGGGGGFSADPLDEWNTRKGGFSEYPNDVDEPDVGDESEDDDFEMVVDDPPERFRAGRGLGAAVQDVSSPYDRELAKARGSGALERRFAKGGRGPSVANASSDSDILAGVGAGGPTHRPARVVGAWGLESRVDLDLFAGRRDFGARMCGAAHDSMSKIRDANVANQSLIRERNELANKREHERAMAKSAREKRVAEKVITIDGAGEEPGRSVGRVSLGSVPVAGGHRGGFTYNAPNRFGGLRGRSTGNMPPPQRQLPRPPWVVPTIDDLLGVALRWSARAVLRSTNRNETHDDDMLGSGPPPNSFPTHQAYVEHFAPLLFHELRAQVGSTMEEAGGVAPGVPVAGVVESMANRFREQSAFHVVKVALSRNQEAAGFAFQENDLVLLEKKNSGGSGGVVDESGSASLNASARQVQRHHAFGFVEGVETGGSGGAGKSWSGASVGGASSLSDTTSGGVRLRVRLCLVEDGLPLSLKWLTGNGGGSLNTPDERERRDGVLRVLQRQGAQITASRVTSVTPCLREIAALLATCMPDGFANAPHAFLRPRKTAVPTSHTTNLNNNGNGIIVEIEQASTRGLNEAQKNAVLAATIVGSRGLGGSETRVVLVQGPPGTGKTKVIAATVDAMLGGGCDSRENGNADSNKPKSSKTLGVSSSSSKYGPAAVAARQRQDDRRKRLSHDSSGLGKAVSGSIPGGNATGAQTQTLPKRRVLVCAQSNSAVDELVSRFASLFASTGKSLVRLGREEVCREDALPFLVNRLVEHRRHVDAREARDGTDAKRAPGSRETKTGSSAADKSSSTSATRARLEKLGEEIRVEESKIGKDTPNKTSRGATSVHLEMLHAQHRLLLATLAQMKQSEKKNAEAVKSSTTGGSAWSRVVGEADVVCCTLSGAGLLATDHRGKGAMRGGRNQGGAHGAIVTASGGIQHHCAVPLFDAVIIDEAAQATELATLIPLRWLRPGGTCVLVGDPKQLAPTVLCKHPTVESCLSRSLFERMQLAGHHAHLLTTQYRMHPSIRAFPSAAFYESKLRDGVDVNAVKSPLGANYVCVDVRDGRETRKRSTSNQSEVSVCVAVYAQLVRNLRIERNARKRGDGDGDELADTIRTVGVVTPYRDQIEFLKRKFAPVLETQDAKFAPVEFATVDGVQGREFDVVLFSCVRASGDLPNNPPGTTFVSADNDAQVSRRAIGFLGDKRRLNVALTRPKHLLVVVGHRTTLRNANSTWRALWDDASRRGRVLETDGVGSVRDALFSFKEHANGFSGFFNVTTERSVPEAVVDLLEDSSGDELDDDDEEEGMEISEPVPTVKLTGVQKSEKRLAAGDSPFFLPAKRLKTNTTTSVSVRDATRNTGGSRLVPSVTPKPGGVTRTRLSVPVAPVTSVTSREKKTTTTRVAEITARERIAIGAARAKAALALSRGGASARGPVIANRVVAPKSKSTDLVGDILRNMRK